MKFTKNDTTHGKNMIKALSKASYTFDGMEVLAFGDVMRWFGALLQKIEMELIEEEAKEKAKQEEDRKLAEGRLIPKPVENITKPMDVPAPVTNMKIKNKK